MGDTSGVNIGVGGEDPYQYSGDNILDAKRDLYGQLTGDVITSGQAALSYLEQGGSESDPEFRELVEQFDATLTKADKQLQGRSPQEITSFLRRAADRNPSVALPDEMPTLEQLEGAMADADRAMLAEGEARSELDAAWRRAMGGLVRDYQQPGELDAYFTDLTPVQNQEARITYDFGPEAGGPVTIDFSGSRAEAHMTLFNQEVANVNDTVEILDAFLERHGRTGEDGRRYIAPEHWETYLYLRQNNEDTVRRLQLRTGLDPAEVKAHFEASVLDAAEAQYEEARDTGVSARANYNALVKRYNLGVTAGEIPPGLEVHQGPQLVIASEMPTAGEPAGVGYTMSEATRGGNVRDAVWSTEAQAFVHPTTGERWTIDAAESHFGPAPGLDMDAGAATLQQDGQGLGYTTRMPTEEETAEALEYWQSFHAATGRFPTGNAAQDRAILAGHNALVGTVNKWHDRDDGSRLDTPEHHDAIRRGQAQDDMFSGSLLYLPERQDAMAEGQAQDAMLSGPEYRTVDATGLVPAGSGPDPFLGVADEYYTLGRDGVPEEERLGPMVNARTQLGEIPETGQDAFGPAGQELSARSSFEMGPLALGSAEAEQEEEEQAPWSYTPPEGFIPHLRPDVDPGLGEIGGLRDASGQTIYQSSAEVGHGAALGPRPEAPVPGETGHGGRRPGLLRPDEPGHSRLCFRRTGNSRSFSGPGGGGHGEQGYRVSRRKPRGHPEGG